jgi:hypothetical protein
MTAEVQTSFARGGTKSSAEARHKRAPRCFTHRGPRVSRRRWTSVNQSVERRLEQLPLLELTDPGLSLGGDERIITITFRAGA